MSRTRGLVALGHHLDEVRALARLQAAWPRLVGPALAERTLPLRVVRGTLVVGCWELTRIAPLREAAAAAWPQLRERIQRGLGLDLRQVQVEPSDPPARPAVPPQDPDPLRRVITLAAERREERVSLGLEPR